MLSSLEFPSRKKGPPLETSPINLIFPFDFFACQSFIFNEPIPEEPNHRKGRPSNGFELSCSRWREWHGLYRGTSQNYPNIEIEDQRVFEVFSYFVFEFFFLFPSQKDCVSGNIFLGFSDISADHFFYGTLTPVSLQKLLEICNINHKLPGVMSTIGFPEGFQVLVRVGSKHELALSQFTDFSSFSL